MLDKKRLLHCFIYGLFVSDISLEPWDWRYSYCFSNCDIDNTA